MSCNVSKLHQLVGEYLRDTLTDAKIEGWPESEANLGHMLGYKEANLRLDYLVTLKNGRSFAVEIQSQLHDDRGLGAWNGSREDHAARLARDKFKKDMLYDLNLPCVEIWEESQIIDMIDLGMSRANVITRADTNETQLVRKIQTRDGGRSVTNWKPRKMESNQKLSSSGNKMQTKSSFGPGHKMQGGSSFNRKEK